MIVGNSAGVLRRTRSENAKYVVDQVRELGLKPHPSCRLMRMCQVLNSGVIEFRDPRMFTALEAERDLQQLGFVFDQLQSHRDDPVFRDLVKKLLKDSVLPQDDSRESIGRNSQFHLYLAAVCQKAGLLPVAYNEPDITCTIDGKEFGIAAKRVKKIGQLDAHIKKAASQIHGSKRPGIIALELSLALNSKNMPIISPLQSQLYVPVAQMKLWQLFDKNRKKIYRWVRGKGVLAVLVFEFSVRLRLDNQWGLDGMSNWLETTEGDQAAQAHYQLFYEQFLKGIPNLERLDLED